MKLKWMSRITQLTIYSHLKKSLWPCTWGSRMDYLSLSLFKEKTGALTPEFWGCWPGLCFDFYWPDILRRINQTPHSPSSRKGVDSTNAFLGYVLQNRWGKTASSTPLFSRLKGSLLMLCPFAAPTPKEKLCLCATQKHCHWKENQTQENYTCVASWIYEMPT